MEDSGIRPVFDDGGISGVIVIIFSLPTLLATALFLAWMARYGKDPRLGPGVEES